MVLDKLPLRSFTWGRWFLTVLDSSSSQVKIYIKIPDLPSVADIALNMPNIFCGHNSLIPSGPELNI